MIYRIPFLGVLGLEAKQVSADLSELCNQQNLGQHPSCPPPFAPCGNSSFPSSPNHLASPSFKILPLITNPPKYNAYLDPPSLTPHA